MSWAGARPDIRGGNPILRQTHLVSHPSEQPKGRPLLGRVDETVPHMPQDFGIDFVVVVRPSAQAVGDGKQFEHEFAV